MQGTVISIPIPKQQAGLPTYVFKLINGSIHQVSPNTLERFVTPSINTSNKI
jgi:hypothetical protein